VGSDLHRLAAAGDFDIELPVGQLSPGPHALRIAAAWRDYEATVKLTINGFLPRQPGPPTYGVSHCGIAVRWRGHTADARSPAEPAVVPDGA
jgi:hypothetical protein